VKLVIERKYLRVSDLLYIHFNRKHASLSHLIGKKFSMFLADFLIERSVDLIFNYSPIPRVSNFWRETTTIFNSRLLS
jgi:hypothetical protein